jgi:hypothetical protein
MREVDFTAVRLVPVGNSGDLNMTNFGKKSLRAPR